MIRPFGEIALTLVVLLLAGSQFLAAAEPHRSNMPLSEEQQVAIEKLIDEFREKYEVPGLSLAMSHRGKPLFSSQSGWADKEENIKVEAHHRFRIASVSKPVTSLMIFKLIENDQLKLTHHPFRQEHLLKPLLEDLELSEEKQTHLDQITIEHLLEHRAGAWSNEVHDPVFTLEAVHLNARDLIRYTIRTFPIQDTPGESYHYSNFGYFLLGRIIEQVTGKSYETAVRDALLKPAGVEKMAIGSRYYKDRLSDEVKYYDSRNDPYHYIMNVQRMDSFGGWVATPEELVRLMNRADGFTHPADLLRKKTLRMMTTSSHPESVHARGWAVNEADNWWHFGSFNGGASILVRTHDQYCWAVLLNTRKHDKDFLPDLDRLPWEILEVLKK